jgi:hypothetical protein
MRPAWFQYWNTVVLRNPLFSVENVVWLLPGLNFIPNKFSPARGR